MDEAAFRRAIREEERRARAAGLAFAEACRAGEVGRMYAAADWVNVELMAWPFAFRALRERVSPAMARAFLAVWVEHKSIASQFIRRTEVLQGLRLLFPPYKGGPVKLYRGEAQRRHRGRTWGVSWTSDPATAEHFATDSFRRHALGGAVVVETLAPTAAILAELPQHYQEREFIVDPRRLERVRIVKRFAE